MAGALQHLVPAATVNVALQETGLMEGSRLRL